jgi:hypothetical protein
MQARFILAYALIALMVALAVVWGFAIARKRREARRMMQGRRIYPKR